nr:MULTISPECIES: hypothetical protein [unclassified Streptomyces]
MASEARRGRNRPTGAIDLLVCATAVRHGHTVLHVDHDFATVAGVGRRPAWGRPTA